MVNLLVEEPYALVRASTGLWEPRAGDGPRPPGAEASWRISEAADSARGLGQNRLLDGAENPNIIGADSKHFRRLVEARAQGHI
jgi:hypothetical protein